MLDIFRPAPREQSLAAAGVHADYPALNRRTREAFSGLIDLSCDGDYHALGGDPDGRTTHVESLLTWRDALDKGATV